MAALRGVYSHLDGRSVSEEMGVKSRWEILILVAIGGQKVGLEDAHIQRDLPNTMCAVDDAQNALLATDSDEFLKGESNTRVTDDGIEDCGADSQSFVPGPSDGFAEAALEFVLGDGVVVVYFSGLEGAVLLHGDDAFLHGSVDGFEIDERFVGLEV
jgi:hypothetical protein